MLSTDSPDRMVENIFKNYVTSEGVISHNALSINGSPLLVTKKVLG